MGVTTIVTGNGFTNNAQKYDDMGSNIIENSSYSLFSISAYTLSFSYRSNTQFSLVFDDSAWSFSYRNLLPINTSNCTTKNFSLNNTSGKIGFGFLKWYKTTSSTTNSIPTSHPTSVAFTIDTTITVDFPYNYIISTGSTSGGTYVRFQDSDSGSWFEGLTTAYNYSTGEITVSSFRNNGTGTASSWDVYVYPYKSFSTTPITFSTTYPTQETLLIGKNLYFQQYQGVGIYKSPDPSVWSYGMIDSYTPSTGSLTISYHQSSAGSGSAWTIEPYDLRSQSLTTITTPTVTGVTVTGYTSTGLPLDIINSGGTGYSGYSNSICGFSSTASSFNAKIQSYNSSTGYFSCYVTWVSGTGTYSSWSMYHAYSGYWIEIDKVNLLPA